MDNQAMIDAIVKAEQKIIILRELLREWAGGMDDDDCGCDTGTCTGMCLAARTRVALENKP